jgi:hypothetical protein
MNLYGRVDNLCSDYFGPRWNSGNFDHAHLGAFVALWFDPAVI